MTSRDIVVGVDGSSHSAAALRWAVDEADARGGTRVVAVLVWDLFNQRHVDGSRRFDPEYDDASAQAALAHFVDEAVGEKRARDIALRPVCDVPVPGLLAAAAEAELLVVGADALRKLKEQGVRQRLVGFVLKERGFPRHGYEVRASGQGAGEVTSGTVSPSLDKGLGLEFHQLLAHGDGGDAYRLGQSHGGLRPAGLEQEQNALGRCVGHGGNMRRTRIGWQDNLIRNWLTYYRDRRMI